MISRLPPDDEETYQPRLHAAQRCGVVYRLKRSTLNHFYLMTFLTVF